MNVLNKRQLGEIIEWKEEDLCSTDLLHSCVKPKQDKDIILEFLHEEGSKKYSSDLGEIDEYDYVNTDHYVGDYCLYYADQSYEHHADQDSIFDTLWKCDSCDKLQYP